MTFIFATTWLHIKYNSAKRFRLNLSLETGLVMSQQCTYEYVWLCLLLCGTKARHILFCSNRDRIGINAEIQIMFGTVCGSNLLFSLLPLYTTFEFTIDFKRRKLMKPHVNIHTLM